jgi:hypothetical protein
MTACGSEPTKSCAVTCELDSDCPSGQTCGGDGRCTDGAACGCRIDMDCTGAAAMVCDVTGTQTCVQCIAPDQASACTGTAPVCGDDHACHACALHAECSDSNTCLPDGSCAAESDIAYVSAAGAASNDCSQNSPCTLAAALTTSKPYVKIAAGKLDEQVSVNRNVTILAEPLAVLSSTQPGILLKVEGSSQLEIYDLEISGASGANPAISIQAGKVTLTRAKVAMNESDGIVVGSTATLIVRQSTIAGNGRVGIYGDAKVVQSIISNNANFGILAGNGGNVTVMQSTVSENGAGGIYTDVGVFDITNNFIYRNGLQGITGGGVYIGADSSGGRLEFNTIVDNRGSTATYDAFGGVSCGVTISAANNIIARNRRDSMPSQAGCASTTSKVQDDLAGLNFESPDASPYSYKLRDGSSAIDQATTASDITVDYFGTTRPKRTGKDVGAHELP